MRILIMGAGAMGSAVGGFMAKAEHDVTLIGREAHMAAIRERGLRITGIWGDHCVTNCTPRTDLHGHAPGNFDLIILTVKSFDTRAAMERVAPLVDENTLVCCYQNGLGNAEVVAEFVGRDRTVGVRAIYGVRVSEPGWVDITVIANPTALGVYAAAAPDDRVREIAAAMDAAGLPTVHTDRIATVLWAKVAYNCALNPMSALLDVPYGALAETEYTRSIMHEVIHELYAVANAMNIALEPGGPDAYLNLFYDELLPPTAAHYASMREDFRHGHRTEIDALNGAICRYGDQHGIPCPTNTTLARLIHAREHALGVR